MGTLLLLSGILENNRYIIKLFIKKIVISGSLKLMYNLSDCNDVVGVSVVAEILNT